MKYLRSTTLGYEDIEIRKSECVAKTQFLSLYKLYANNLQTFLCNPFPYNIGFPRIKNFQNPNTESGGKKTFSLVHKGKISDWGI